MWISKTEYNEIIRKVNMLDNIKMAIQYHENYMLEDVVILATEEYNRICSSSDLKEQIEQLEEECNKWKQKYKEILKDSEFWKSSYVDMRKSYEKMLDGANK